MITKEILELYLRFDGQQRSLTGATREELAANNGCDWDDIDSYIQDIVLVERGLAVPTFTDEARNNCDSEETFSFLRKIALSQE